MGSESVVAATAEDDDEPQGSHFSPDDATGLYSVGYTPEQIDLAERLLASGMEPEEVWFRVGDPQEALRQQKPRQPFITINVKTPDEVVTGMVAKAEPVLRPYMVYGGATLSLVGHSAGFGTGFVLVVSPEPTASKGVGVYMMAVNADGMIADIRTLATGVPQSTLLHTAVRDGLVQAGMDEREAERAAVAVELGSNGFQAYKVAVMMPGSLSGAAPVDLGVNAAGDVSAESLAVRNLPSKLFNYTDQGTAALIERSQLGLPGRQTYLTANGELTPLQAQIELALPQRNTASALFEVNAEALEPSKVLFQRRVTGNLLNRAGGGVEIIYDGPIPLENVRRLK